MEQKTTLFPTIYSHHMHHHRHSSTAAAAAVAAHFFVCLFVCFACLFIILHHHHHDLNLYISNSIHTPKKGKKAPIPGSPSEIVTFFPHSAAYILTWASTLSIYTYMQSCIPSYHLFSLASPSFETQIISYMQFFRTLPPSSSDFCSSFFLSTYLSTSVIYLPTYGHPLRIESRRPIGRWWRWLYT